MPRFFLSAGSWPADVAGGLAVLDADESRHLVQVLRLREGAEVVVFDGGGRQAVAVVTRAGRGGVELRVGAAQAGAALRPRILLAQAIPKGRNMDGIVQKAVELGVAGIQPLVTARTIVHPGEGKAGRWQRTALEACKQCGQNLLPEIPEAVAYRTWIRELPPGPGLRVIASLAPGARPLREVLRVHPETAEITLLVGPEGDFTPEETTQAIDAGFLPVSLGAIVLRVETATQYCLAAVRYEFGEG